MPTDLQDAETGGANLVFVDDLTGVRFRVSEAQLFSAEEVRSELDQGEEGTPQYGRWLPVEIEDEDSWVLCPGELVQELQREQAAPGEVYEVTRAEKSGNGETDPWEINIEAKDEGTQTRL